jgi:hypothetical protein
MLNMKELFVKPLKIKQSYIQQYVIETIQMDGSRAYWLETPRSNSSYSVWGVDGYFRAVYSTDARSTSLYGIRPVIEVKTSNILN